MTGSEAAWHGCCAPASVGLPPGCMLLGHFAMPTTQRVAAVRRATMLLFALVAVHRAATMRACPGARAPRPWLRSLRSPCWLGCCAPCQLVFALVAVHRASPPRARSKLRVRCVPPPWTNMALNVWETLSHERGKKRDSEYIGENREERR